EIDVFCLCAQQRRKRGGAALLPVIAQTVYLIFNHVQSDASASGKGGHPRDAGRKFAKVTAPCCLGRGRKSQPGAPRFGVKTHAVASECGVALDRKRVV